MKIQAAIGVVLFVGLLAVIEVQTGFYLLRKRHLLPEPALHGVVEPIPKPALSLESWWDGRFQRQVQGSGGAEGWIDRHVGLRPVWIKTDNQINFSLFREIPRHAGPQDITLGKNNWLYEEDYVTSFIGREIAPDKQLRQYASDLRQLQDELKRRGITMLLVISPSKAIHYPEYLPDWILCRRLLFSTDPRFQGALDGGVISPELRRRFADHRISLSEDASLWVAERGSQWLITDRSDVYTVVNEATRLDVYCQHDPREKLNYDRLMPLLKQQRVDCVDAARLFRQQKRTYPQYRLFPRGGTHWTYYGAGLVAAEMLARLKGLTGKDLVQFTCDAVTVDCRTTGTDNDLGDVLNLWTPWVTKGPTPHPRIVSTGGQWRPNVLWVGDSFSWTLTELMDTHRVYRRRDMLFVFGRKMTYPEGRSYPIDPGTFDWPRELADRDILIIETNEARLSELAYYFVDWAMMFFRGQRAEPAR